MKPKTFLQREFHDDFLICRDTGHSWELREWHHKPSEGVHRHFQCRVCRTERLELIGRTSGEVYSRRYKYPPGYLIKDREIRKGISKSTIRVESLRRLIKGVGVG